MERELLYEQILGLDIREIRIKTLACSRYAFLQG